MENPAQAHAQFDAICAELGEWDTLPTLTSTAAEPDRAGAEEAEGSDTELDGLIFAGLVSPY